MLDQTNIIQRDFQESNGFLDPSKWNQPVSKMNWEIFLSDFATHLYPGDNEVKAYDSYVMPLTQWHFALFMFKDLPMR